MVNENLEEARKQESKAPEGPGDERSVERVCKKAAKRVLG